MVSDDKEEDVEILGIPDQILNGDFTMFDEILHTSKKPVDLLVANLVVVCMMKNLDYVGVVTRLAESGRFDAEKSDLMTYLCDYKKIQSLLAACFIKFQAPNDMIKDGDSIVGPMKPLKLLGDQWKVYQVVFDLVGIGVRFEYEHAAIARKYYSAEDVSALESEAIDFKINRAIEQGKIAEKSLCTLCTIRRKKTSFL